MPNIRSMRRQSPSGRPERAGRTGPAERTGPAGRSARSDDAVPSGLRIGAAFTWRILVVGAGLAVLVALVVLLQDIVVPFLIALLVCALLMPMSSFLQRHRWPKWTAVLSSLVALVLALGGLALLVTEQVRSDLPSLERRLHHSVQSLRTLLDSEPFGITAKDVDSWVSNGFDYLQAHAATILSGFQAAGTGAVHVLEGLFIIVFTTLFVLIDGPRIWGWVVRLFPRRARARIDVAGHAGWKTLTSFIRVQLVVAVTDALGVTIGALALQIPLAIPIGVIVFFGAFVPVVGAIVAGAVAVLIALVFNGWVPALVMLGIVVVVQQLESHVLHPFLTGTAVKVHPLGVVLGVTAGTTIAGVVGAFFAVPFIATVNAMVVAAANWRPGDPEPMSATVPKRERSGPAARLLARAQARERRADHGGVQS